MAPRGRARRQAARPSASSSTRSRRTASRRASRRPRALNKNLYDAQRARRVLDRIVGYDVSALVWSKLAFGLSAGRVQSVALRLIVDREREIEAFVPEEYWNCGAAARGREGDGKPPLLRARLAQEDGKKLEVKDGADGRARCAPTSRRRRIASRRSRRASASARRPRRTRRASCSRTRSTASASAPSARCRSRRGSTKASTSARTLGTGRSHHVHAYRLDARLARGGRRGARRTSTTKYGKDARSREAPNVFKSKKNAQDAHEAIRPTSLDYPPDAVRKHLKDEQYKLYKLIWDRFVASQMKRGRLRPDERRHRGEGRGSARYGLRASGRVLKFAGWLEVYGAGARARRRPAAKSPRRRRDEAKAEDDERGHAARAQRGRGPRARHAARRARPSRSSRSRRRATTKARSCASSRSAASAARARTPRSSARCRRATTSRRSTARFQPDHARQDTSSTGSSKSKLDFMDPTFTSQHGGASSTRSRRARRSASTCSRASTSASASSSSRQEGQALEPRARADGREVRGLRRRRDDEALVEERLVPRLLELPEVQDDARPGRRTATAPRRRARPTSTATSAGSRWSIRSGRYGEFLSCTGYPDVQERAARAARRPVPEVRRRPHRDPPEEEGRQDVLRVLELQQRDRQVRLQALAEADPRAVPALRREVPRHGRQQGASR